MYKQLRPLQLMGANKEPGRYRANLGGSVEVRDLIQVPGGCSICREHWNFQVPARPCRRRAEVGQIQSPNLLQTGSPHHHTSINTKILFHILFSSYFLLPVSYPLLLVSSEISDTCEMSQVKRHH